MLASFFKCLGVLNTISSLCLFGFSFENVNAQTNQSPTPKGIDGIWITADSSQGFVARFNEDNTKLEIKVLTPGRDPVHLAGSETNLFVSEHSERNEPFNIPSNHNEKTPVWFSLSRGTLVVHRPLESRPGESEQAIARIVFRLVSEDHLSEEFQFSAPNQVAQKPTVKSYFRAGSQAHFDAAKRVESGSFSGRWILTSATEVSGDGSTAAIDRKESALEFETIEISLEKPSIDINVPEVTQSVEIRNSEGVRFPALFSMPERSRLVAASTRVRTLAHGLGTEVVQAWVPESFLGALKSKEQLTKLSFANTSTFGEKGIHRVIYLAISRNEDELTIIENDVEYPKEGACRVTKRTIYRYSKN